ncbi:MAG: GxxExxY protein [Saprospiraceae bacterium]
MKTNIKTHNEISKDIIGAAIKIHKVLGPGLLESVYEEVLYYELTNNLGYKVQRQKAIDVVYEGIKMEKGFRADLIVENKVLIELKSVQTVIDVFKKTTLTYLRLSDLKLGLLLNFNESKLIDGITRIVNNL